MNSAGSPGGVRRVTSAVGSVLRTLLQALGAAFGAGSDRPNGPLIAPDTERARRPEDYRP